MLQVRDTMKEELSLMDVSADPPVIKQVYDHIRYSRKKTLKTIATIEATTRGERIRQWNEDHHNSNTSFTVLLLNKATMG